MKLKFIFLFTFLFFIISTYAQQNAAWTNWSWLIGELKGEGSGQPGQGGGTFSFQTDLDEKILVRKSHSEYPATGNRPAAICNDLMIITLDFKGHPTKTVYFDNEGHTINYTITNAPKTIVLLSDKIPNVPIFRLTYFLMDDQMVNTKFEMSQDGEIVMTYIEGKSAKIN